MTLLPRHDKAVIPIEKFTKYCLDPKRDPNKASAFLSVLGYGKENAEMLINDIRCNLSKFPATPRGDKGFGMTYEVLMTLQGLNHKTAKVKTGWIDEKATGEMRLVTAFVDK